MKKILSVIFISAVLFSCNDEKKADAPADKPADVKVSGEKPPVELLDNSLVAPTKASMAAFENKDVNGYTDNMADNVRFTWSGGDSLVGKQAVKDYYTGRFNIIDTIRFSNPIFLPIKANVSPNGGATAAGTWMLDWYMVNVKYKNGKRIGFWVHNAMHYNDAGKIDQVAQYIDRHPIMEATKDMVKK